LGHRGQPPAGPPEPLREPVHGPARGLEDAPARARQRTLRGAARPGAARERRALLRELRGVRGSARLAARAPAGGRRAGRGGPRVLRGELRLARRDGEVRAAARLRAWTVTGA